jgi:uncharacterized protein (DUF924 family)
LSLPDPDEVHRFWFGTATDWARCVERNYPRWFQRGHELDVPVRERFAYLLDAARQGALEHWLQSPRGALSLVITLDQFPRHIHRGTPDAFAFDGRARAACEAGIQRGHDGMLSVVERSFFYLPLEHAEDAQAQQRCVTLMASLRADDPGLSSFLAEVLRYARLHQEIITRFGRFPHRNAALGRISTPEECAYLEEGGTRFGQ